VLPPLSTLLQLRTAWIPFQLAVEDIQSQKLGVIVVVYNLGGFPKGGNDWEKSRRRLSQVVKSMPIRFDAFLPCFDDIIWDAFVRYFSFMVSRFLRVRFRPLSGKKTATENYQSGYRLIATRLRFAIFKQQFINSKRSVNGIP
jgi:hypothetical protein